MSKIIGDQACPQCRESGGDKTGNHLIIFADGNRYCPKCEYFEQNGEAQEEETEAPIKVSKGSVGVEEIEALSGANRVIRDVRVEFMDLYETKVQYSGTNGEPEFVFFPVYREGKLQGYKKQGLLSKSFVTIGDGKDVDLAGMPQVSGKKLAIVTEGHWDMLATKQMLAAKGKDYTVVSLPNGANTKLNTYSFEWLSSFESIILALDSDEPGQEAAKELAEMFEGGKVKLANLPAKDANDCLSQGLGDEFFSAIMSAKKITADGVIDGEDTWDVFLEALKAKEGGGIPYPWESLNEYIYGVRRGEIDTFTSGTGMGKTQLLREIQYHLAVEHGQRLGVMSLEEPMEDSLLGQMSIQANAPLHLPDVQAAYTEEQLHELWKLTYGSGHYVLYDHFGSLEQSALTSKIRYLAVGMGCTHIILDHLSIVVSEYASEGDERKIIDEIMSKLKRLTQELKIWIGLVVHLRKSGGVPFNLGGVPSIEDLRSSGSIAQLSNQVIAVSRNQQHEDVVKRNTSALHVLKNRFTGRTGPAGLLYYDEHTGRMVSSGMSLEDYNEGGDRGGLRVS